MTASESGVAFRARSRVLALIASSPMFFENKRKTTSVYRLYCIGADVMSNSTMQHKPSVMSHEFVEKDYKDMVYFNRLLQQHPFLS